MWPGAEHSGGLQQGQVLNDRQLTAAIRNATAEERLAQLADAHRLNPIHMAAILTKLANISKKQPSQGSKPTNVYAMRSMQIRQQLVQKLQHQLILQGCQGHCPRGLANIIWALAKLQCSPDLELVQMLLQGFCNQLHLAVPQVRQRRYMGCNSAMHGPRRCPAAGASCDYSATQPRERLVGSFGAGWHHGPTSCTWTWLLDDCLHRLTCLNLLLLSTSATAAGS